MQDNEENFTNNFEFTENTVGEASNGHSISVTFDNDLPEGYERVDLTGILEGKHVIIDTEKVTRKWTKLLDKGEEGLYEALESIIVSSDLPYELSQRAFLEDWPMKKLNLMGKEIMEHISGPKEPIS